MIPAGPELSPEATDLLQCRNTTRLASSELLKMRLLNVHSLDFFDYHLGPSDIPKYVIASHRWGRAAETSLEEVQGRLNTQKTGYKKVLNFVKYVKSHISGIDWLWIDTCCIDNRNSQEVSTAINSMFRWYARAEICLAYLADVNTAEPEKLCYSEWWTRAWTLQELLAPRVVVFLAEDWQVIGHKGGREPHESLSNISLGPPLEALIASFSGIPEKVLRDYENGRGIRPEERLEWAAGRKASREEDISYCLLGLLDVAMVANYGEGGEKARRRLLREMSEANREAVTASNPDTTQPQYSNLGDGKARSQHIQSLHKKLLESFSFPELEARRNQIGVTFHGTYQWVLVPPLTTTTRWDNLIAWVRDPEPASRFYWINAKPGAGKSSLTRFLEDNLDQNQHMQPWSQHSQVVMISYYFWNPGNTLQNTLTGLFCSILSQLICRYPEELVAALPPNRNSASQIGKAANGWAPFELRKYLTNALSTMPSSTRILFLIDGLDEIDGTDDNRDDLLEFLRDLARYPFVKLCVSSRRWPVFQDAFNMCPQLRLEDLNARDIESYVRGQLQSQDRFLQMLLYNGDAGKLVEDILVKASGVFLWVRLIVKDVVRAIRDGDSLETLQRKIRDVPGDLGEYFSHMLESIEIRHRSQASALLQIALHRESEWIQLSSLRLLDIIFIGHGGDDFASSAHLERYVNVLSDTNALIYTLDAALRTLSSRCKGLLECYFQTGSAFRGRSGKIDSVVVSALPTSIVEEIRSHKNAIFDLGIDFMHRSLRDYLLEPENQHFLHQYTAGPFDARNYLRNARLCQFFMTRQWELRSEATMNLASFFICTLSSPQFRSTTRCLQLAKRFEPAMDFLLSSLRYVPYYWYIHETFRCWEEEQSDFLTLAIDFGWTAYINETLTAEVVRAKRGRPILDYVLRPRFCYREDIIAIGNQTPVPELVEQVLSLGADPNEVYEGASLSTLFVSFIAEMYHLREMSQTQKSAYSLSLRAMIRAGAKTG